MPDRSSYLATALPPLHQALKDMARQVGVSRAIGVGSAWRDADNGLKDPQSYSVYIMPGRGENRMSTADIVRAFCDVAGPGGKFMRSENIGLRNVIELANGATLNLNFCDQLHMFQAGTMVGRVPNAFSAIAVDLFTGETHATASYQYDKQQKRITQLFPEMDPGNRIALSVQRRYPDHPVCVREGSMFNYEGSRVLYPALTARPAAP